MDDSITEAPSAARAAAIWWAEQVGAPTFRNVDENSGSLQDTIASGYPVGAEQGEKFAAELEQAIGGQLEGQHWNVHLGVDYGPDLMLAEAADKAGIDRSRFPWKTRMSVHSDYVTAALGYRAADKLIWQSPTWQRPACETQRYEESADGYFDEICPLPLYHDGDHGDWIADPYRCAECGGTYTDHYGEGVEYPGHSWNPHIP